MSLIPVLTDRPPPDDTERNLYTLPARLCGVNAVTNPVSDMDLSFQDSATISVPLKEATHSNSPDYSYDIRDYQISSKSEICNRRHQQSEKRAKTLKQY